MACPLIFRNGRFPIDYSRKFASLSTELKPVQLAVAKRTQNDPTNQSVESVGLFYTIPDSVKNQLFKHGGFPKSLQTNFKTFGETCLMVRKPAIEIIEHLKKTDLSKPVVRYVLYGKPGCGKSVTLAHVLHYAYLSGFFIVHVPWVWNWFRNVRTEVTPSSVRPEVLNLPLLAAQWLKHFQMQNSHLLKDLKIPISKDYVWNPRESTPAGSLISDLVDHGMNRVKYADDCVHAIVTELKQAATENKCKVFAAIDGFNGLFSKVSNLKLDRVEVAPEKVSLTQTFLEIAKQDWNNGAVVMTVDQMSARHCTLDSHLPLFLLGKEGFEHIDPFILVNVPELSNLEFNSMLDYYEDRKWLLRKGGREELSFVSNNNPYSLMNLCAGL